MQAFDYYEPATLSEALDLLEREPRLLPLAGGTNAVVDLRERRIEVPGVVALGRLAELRRIRVEEDMLAIGALVTARSLLRDPRVAQHADVLVEATGQLGAPSIRNLATIGGNLVQASPAADLAPPLLALGARVRLVSTRGERIVALDEFFRGPGESLRRPDELLAEVVVPMPRVRTRGCFLKLGRRKALAISIASVAAVVTLEPSTGDCREIRVAMGAVAPTPVRLPSVETALRGAALSPELMRRAAAACVADIAPVTDERARAAYRAAVAPVLVRRAVEQAAARARAA